MKYTDKFSRVRHCFIIIFAAALLAACNTTAPVRSSGAPGSPGSPGPSGSPGSPGSSGPSVQVSVPGMPEVPGVPGVPGTGTGGIPDAPTPGTISIPVTQPGLPTGEAGGVPSAARSGDGRVPAGSQGTAGTGRQKSDDEILAEALEEMNKRSGSAQQVENGETTGRQLSQAGGGGSTRTDAEKQQALGEELQEGFSEFDRIMLSEQQANNERAGQEGYGAFPEDDDIFAEGEPAQGQADEPLQTAMVDTDPVSIKGEGNIPTRSHSRVPPDLVDAKGDDIIARQLREAAMKEEDPELREKLWDEYRKYKRDLR